MRGRLTFTGCISSIAALKTSVLFVSVILDEFLVKIKKLIISDHQINVVSLKEIIFTTTGKFHHEAGKSWIFEAKD